MLEDIRSRLHIVWIAFWHEVAILAVAAMARAGVYIVEQLYDDDVPEAVETAEEFSLGFFILAILLQAALEVIRSLLVQLGALKKGDEDSNA